MLVGGISRTSICDLQRGNIYLIPNSLAEMFTDSRFIDLSKILPELDSESKVVLQEYISFLKENELAFHCEKEKIERFPPISNEWLFPAHISNCILDAYGHLSYFDTAFLSQLEKLCCNFIQIRFFADVSLQYLSNILEEINKAQIKSVDIILPQQNYDSFYSEITLLVDKNKKIKSLLVSCASENVVINDGRNGTGILMKTIYTNASPKHCGVINHSLFSINIPTYTESLAHNTCLNRKISIDVDGNIKNCPSMSESFGNIKDTTLQEAIDKTGFKKYWNISKDQIDVCKDCEFRHVCTDCRAYLETPENDYSKPLKCGYNPYTCEWEEWSVHPFKQQAISYYKL